MRNNCRDLPRVDSPLPATDDKARSTTMTRNAHPMQHPAPARTTHAVRPTITDVAKIADVSRQTVSRVARGGAGVKPATAARVQRVIDQLGYRPHLVARALSSGSSRVFGVLMHDVGSTGDSINVVSGIERAANAADYAVSVVSIGEYDDLSVESGLDRLLRAGCDGIVLMAPWASDAASLRAFDFPVPVVTTSQIDDFAGPSVCNDTETAARAVVTHLLSLGHRTVHHVSGPPTWNAAKGREHAWRQVLEEAGAPVPPVVAGDWSAAAGYRAGRELARDSTVTAVFAANDEMALGVIHALADAGRRVPGDVSVVGFDNTPRSAHFLPPLTTVGFDGENHSRRAVEVLLDQLAGRPVPHRTVLEHEMVVRESTAPPRS
jgi:LacI family transcriptional regulator